jgi:hypothetical protein
MQTVQERKNVRSIGVKSIESVSERRALAPANFPALAPKKIMPGAGAKKFLTRRWRCFLENCL